MHSQRHIRDFIFDTVAQAKLSGRTHEICFIKATDTQYSFVDNYPFPANNLSILTTSKGGNTRWVAFSGRYAPRLREIAYIIALG